MRSIALISLISLAGCASTPAAWDTVNGANRTSGDLQAAVTICQGEVQKTLIQGQMVQIGSGMNRHELAVYEGCMAQHGFLAHR